MKVNIIPLEEIKKTLAGIDIGTLVDAMEQSFVAYSEGRAVVPPVGLLQFDKPPGDVHIKYGYIHGEDVYVIKVAASFYDNQKRGLPSSHGLMLVFSQETGALLSILLDEGHVTNVRTALAGAVVAKYLAPSKVKAVGIVGTGTQARLQLQYLTAMIDCRNVYVWGRSNEALQKYVADMKVLGLDVTPTRSMQVITDHCNYIVTTTPSHKPLIMSKQVHYGTHITAVGADAPGKQELDPALLQRADMLIVDSKSQCSNHGEVAYAIRQGLMSSDSLIELGSLIKNGLWCEHDSHITIADLTGVAVQDITIAKIVYAAK